ncbi:MAG: DUF971 domain-containing protein [Acidobacteriota bacterium]
MSTVQSYTPTAITQAGDRHLAITWADGRTSRLDVVELRRRCPCAQCVDEWSGRPLLDRTSIPDTVRPTNVRSVGLYAISIAFSDGHDSGIYTFELLRSLDTP